MTTKRLIATWAVLTSLGTTVMELFQYSTAKDSDEGYLFIEDTDAIRMPAAYAGTSLLSYELCVRIFGRIFRRRHPLAEAVTASIVSGVSLTAIGCYMDRGNKIPDRSDLGIVATGLAVLSWFPMGIYALVRRKT